MKNSEEAYRTLCSLETLRSGKKGFFRDFSEHAMQVTGEHWIANVFGRLGNDDERMRTIFSDPKIKGVVSETLGRVRTLFRDKEASVSRSRRLEGFQAAAEGRTEKALLLLSQAVLRAPRSGKCETVDRGFGLVLALLGRAEILMTMKEHDLALEDLHFAAETDLPNELSAEVTRKMEECKVFLRANDMALVPANRDKTGKGWQRSSRTKQDASPGLSGGENPCLPGASALIEIQETAIAGKQAVASKEIHPGDILVVEPPLAACLLPEFFGTHCQHCYSRLIAPIGCPECSSVAFCGRTCRDIALSTYHKYECKILAMLIGSGMSVLSILALRMVTQEGAEKCWRMYHTLAKSNCETTKESTDTTLETNSRIKLSRSAKRRMRKKKLEGSRSVGKDGETDDEEDVDTRAYDLVMHETRRTSKDFMERSLMAAFLLKCLQRVNFFSNTTRDDETPSEKELAVGVLLLKNLQLLQFNAHEFFETRLGSEHLFRGSRPLYLGVAIYPTVARFNHDCYPAVTRYFVGRNIVIRSTRCLNPGDVVAENYGPIFTKRSLKERQRTLAGRYWFRCTCRSCKENWPCFQDLTNNAARLKCPTEGCAMLHSRKSREANKTIKCCPSCQKKIDLGTALKSLEECEDLYARGFAMMDEEKSEEAISLLIKAASMFHSVAEPPHKDTHLAEIALSSCMAYSGNIWQPVSS